ncbi:hypothetical protein ABIB35_000899 [Arthrobacter sp. UYP6]|uniref:DUF3887 domain-containing protein n=1 Tax=Arthrobacter sp. UYP6 TaxID=1756378 RepID=UPI0033943B08
MAEDQSAASLISALLVRTQALAAGLNDGKDHESTLLKVRTAAALRSGAEALLSALVEDARHRGATWQEVGTTLGISRQAAYQRFGHAVDPRTGSPLATSAFEVECARATRVFDLLRAGRGGDIYSDFNEAMQQALTHEQLGDVWANILATVGSFGYSGHPAARRIGELTVVDVPLHFEAGTMIGRVSFAGDSKIAGLYILNADIGDESKP